MILIPVAHAQTENAAALHEKFTVLKEQLQHNQFKQPLFLESSETPDQLKGNIYAVVDYPFAAVGTGLKNPDHWCDVMLLHQNTKYCRASPAAAGTVLKVNIGKKTPEALADSSRIELSFNLAAASPDYFKIGLNAKDGPMGTRDYRIVLEAVPLSNTTTFIHLTYSYGTNFAGRIAMQTYLATAGRGKVGFTAIGRTADGEPEYIRGVRGLVERNTMRYYFAIDAFLGAANLPPAEQFERRLQNWYSATEHYPRQLHELERSEYMTMKRAENQRQHAVQ